MHDYPGIARSDLDHFALGGRWKVDDESAEAVERRDAARARPRQVRLPRARRRQEQPVDVTVDGERVRTVTVDGQRLYALMHARAPPSTLTLRFEPGVAGYAFTFG